MNYRSNAKGQAILENNCGCEWFHKASMSTANEQGMTEPQVWHYTILTTLRMILDDGLIKPTDVMIEPGEKPAAWFSSNQVWEPTATKSVCDERTGKLRDATFEDMVELGGGIVRIGVNRGLAGLLKWYDFKRTSGISTKMAKGLEIAAYKMGAKPEHWFATFSPVPIEQWTAVQILQDGCWMDMACSR